MRRFGFFRLKNAMLLGNFFSNLAGVLVVDIISHRSLVPTPPQIQDLGARLDWVFIPSSFFLMTVATLFYERPIRLSLEKISEGLIPGPEFLLKARRRLLNEPFVLMGMNLLVWCLAAFIYPFFFTRLHPGEMLIVRVVLQTVLVGLVTTIIAFFVLEQTLQKRVAPVLFPKGRLNEVSKTLKIRISTRLAALVFAINTIPMLAFLGIISGIRRSGVEPEKLMGMVHSTMLVNCLIFAGVGLFLFWLVSVNLTSPFDDITRTLKHVSQGRLDRRVRVISNDEIGYTGDIINEMTAGLREREQMRRSLELAREVQQSLLPNRAPRVKGLDIAGSSIYCDQTGGDYYDYFHCKGGSGDRVALIVGDVSDHGIPSALLMATARAFLKLRSVLPGTLTDIISDVNRLLVQDVEDTGQFMTLFYLTIDLNSYHLKWIRAGHDPALLYDPLTDAFLELGGPGMALGVSDALHCTEGRTGPLKQGQILLLGTDGLWECQNPGGDMFGKHRLQEEIRKHQDRDAQGIVDAVVEAITRFQKGAAASDDVTLVVVKRKT